VNCRGLARKRHGLIDALLRNLYGDNEENQENFRRDSRCPGSDSNRMFRIGIWGVTSKAKSTVNSVAMFVLALSVSRRQLQVRS
jgi:hypothetical protein